MAVTTYICGYFCGATRKCRYLVVIGAVTLQRCVLRRLYTAESSPDAVRPCSNLALVLINEGRGLSSSLYSSTKGVPVVLAKPCGRDQARFCGTTALWRTTAEGDETGDA